ncbi:lysophospholipase L1-like esterase [Spinactinospora alkalitolerans]|uniref:Lysophospholipase L1-like esterase n=1 Tax=Spinactinospora alkalitolerans TaxID=687207 RepID=A0A852TRQ7_9ACTN|nr:SGNH/GDSL hydrolase family protein [Spinactinospora alkalitolerans]NYE45532.1 lysophospholipase L1-like esterase [Spinactinospora alkalitolerans]
MRWRACAAAAAVAALVAGGCSSGGGDETPEKRFYLSLGDSLAVGVQPGEDGGYAETDEGYTDALYRALYDRDSTLEHVRMGCGGEDSSTFVSGGMADCDYEEGSQLATAEAFLQANRSDVALVTVDVGANNFTRCAYDGSGEVGTDIDEECVEDGLRRLREEAPAIAERLRSAAGEDVQIIGMTYYNPFLAALLLEDLEGAAAGLAGEGRGDGGEPEEDSGEDLARYSNDVLAEMNRVLTEAYGAAGIDVADVSAAFESGDFEVPAGSDTGMPANVQRICDYTWMCNTDRGPDIHTNRAGANEIAEVFEEVVELP